MISCVVSGSLGQNAELKELPNGNKVVNFSVASHGFAGGEKTTTWVNVSFFGDRAEKILSFLAKGRYVTVRGSGALREFDAKTGGKKTILQVRADDVELGSGGDKSADATPGTQASLPARTALPPQSRDPNAYQNNNDLADDIPF